MGLAMTRRTYSALVRSSMQHEDGHCISLTAEVVGNSSEVLYSVIKVSPAVSYFDAISQFLLIVEISGCLSDTTKP